MDTPKSNLLNILRGLDLGSSVAEVDSILYEARVETGTFWALFNDRVDLIPGAKGSGKSALFQLFVRHLPDMLLKQRKVILAHGAEPSGDQVFQVFANKFERLSDTQFQNFWFVYFVSLVNEQLLKPATHQQLLAGCTAEVRRFSLLCNEAHIPNIEKPLGFKGIVEWCLDWVKSFRPSKATVSIGDVNYSFEWKKDEECAQPATAGADCPLYVADIRTALSSVLEKADLTVWLMLDKLDELFPRWSEVEKRGLRTLLRAMHTFSGDRIRVKIFLREDIFEHITASQDGFPGLSHVTARMASSLNWSAPDILHLIVKRLFANARLARLCSVTADQLDANQEYRERAFYEVFPQKVHRGTKQSPTLAWVYNRCQDGRKVVAPRDVVDLLIFTRDAEIESLESDHEGSAGVVFSPPSLKTGFERMSKKKKDVFLHAEFPHYRDYILKFEGGPAIYPREALRRKLGKNADELIERLKQIGFLSEYNGSYQIPFLYRPAFNVRQTRAT